ncbi:glycosyltransferase family 4 protein [Hymenobacter wooponensis]|uniref:Glycosyltransferase n=1 Tax=Hymenobacter wooponensis TaxID=1525360 RepID=A0A4Z0MLN8_9BACT|nr:glycosyltransferase family 4 protein [Hymenobacter wooponensis]TGD80534.1 glycosyltransferase [Hymenobacter wooponensis]
MRTTFPANILMTADTVGGVWTYALELSQALAPYGTRVALATMGAPLTQAQWNQVADIPTLTVYESTYKLEWMDDPWEDVARAGEWLLQLEAQVQPDVVHLNGLVHGNLPWRTPTLAVVHSCVLSWWQTVKGEEAPASWHRYRTEVQSGLRAADVVVAPTATLLGQAEQLYGPFRQQATVYNGLHLKHFRMASKEPFIFSMGRVWDEAKNILLLAEIAEQLPWPVYIAGNAQHPATGQHLKLPNVHFLGQLSAHAAADWLSRAAIYVMPAKYEPFGLTLLEAALSGCALVAGDIATLREVWGEAACYALPADGKALASTIKGLIENTLLRQQMADRARKQASRYTTEQMALAYGRLYHQLRPKAAGSRFAALGSTLGLAALE